MAYESIKIHAADYEAAKAIRADRGLPIIDCVGVAIAAWSRLSRKQQDEIIRERSQRKHEESEAA